MISIIVPIYKVEKYLKQCVDSILAQTCGEIEIILVDDGSPDRCPEMCDAYAAAHSRVKVIHKPNGGLVSARKAGLAAASGSYIGFVDGDDWIEPNMYELMNRLAEKYNPDMVLSEFYYDFEDHRESSGQSFSKEYYDKDEMKDKLYPTMLFAGSFYRFGINPCCWSKLFKKELLERNLQLVDDRIKMGEDAAFTYPCLLEAESICAVKEPGYHYRINRQSMTKTYDPDMHKMILLPFYRIEEKNRESDYDLSCQLNYYLIYLVNFAVRNEAMAGKTRTPAERSEILKSLVQNPKITDAAGRVTKNLLPFHTRLLVYALRRESLSLIRLYTVLLKRYLKGK